MIEEGEWGGGRRMGWGKETGVGEGEWGGGRRMGWGKENGVGEEREAEIIIDRQLTCGRCLN